MKRRIISIATILAMIVTMLPAAVWAEPGDTSAAAKETIQIKIGDYLVMGSYYDESILWRCVDIDENGPLMLSDKILCLKPFDAKGTDINGSHGRGFENGVYRQSNGSNYWEDSNIRDWLNSTASAGNVVWSCGNPPDSGSYNAYDDEAGFLTNFTSSEQNAMKGVKLKQLLDRYEYSSTGDSNYHKFSGSIESVLQNYDTAYSEISTKSDKMFLMDVKQVHQVYSNSGILGSDYYIGQPTAKCVENSKYTSSNFAEGKNWDYWLRSPNCGNLYNFSGDVRYVWSGGDVGDKGAYECDCGVRPAFYLDLTSSSIASGEGTETAPYRIGVGSGINETTQVKIGDYLMMGSYYDEPILWRCVDIDENGTLMLSDKVLCMKAFDAAGSNVSGSHRRGHDSGSYRQRYGSNYWEDSNIRDWLNSTASAGNVVWSCGNPPDADHVEGGYNAYDDEAGFLTNFTSYEQNAIKNVKLKQLLDRYEYSSTCDKNCHTYNASIENILQNYDTAYSEISSKADKMFLMDVKQVHQVYSNSGILGSDYYIGKPTAGLMENSEYAKDHIYGGTMYYWLRSPYCYVINYDFDVRSVFPEGNVMNSHAYGSLGIRPAFYLDLASSSIASGEGTETAPYRLGTGSGTPEPDNPTPALKHMDWNLTEGKAVNNAKVFYVELEEPNAEFLEKYINSVQVSYDTSDNAPVALSNEKRTVSEDGKRAEISYTMEYVRVGSLELTAVTPEGKTLSALATGIKSGNETEDTDPYFKLGVHNNRFSHTFSDFFQDVSIITRDNTEFSEIDKKYKKDTPQLQKVKSKSGGYYYRKVDEKGGATYKMRSDYLQKLLRNQNLFARHSIQTQNNDIWNGACLGVAMSMTLANMGALKDLFPDDYYRLPYPNVQNNRLRDVIHYYQLYQKRNDYRPDDSVHNGNLFKGNLRTFLKNLVEQAQYGQEVQKPFLFNYYYTDGGHSVVVLGYKKGSLVYKNKCYTHHLQIYDCNAQNGFLTMHISDDFSNFYFEDGNGVILQNVWKNLSFMGIDTIEGISSDFPRKNILMRSLSSTAESDKCNISFSAYKKFTLTNDRGKKLSYNGSDYCGDLQCELIKVIGEINPEIVISVDGSSQYTITDFEDDFKISVEIDGRYYTASAPGANYILFDKESGIVLNGDGEYQFAAGMSTDLNSCELVRYSGETSGTCQVESVDLDIILKSENNCSNVNVETYQDEDYAIKELENAVKKVTVKDKTDIETEIITDNNTESSIKPSTPSTSGGGSGGGSVSSSNSDKVDIDSSVSHGKVTVDKETAKKGETVTITAAPDEGYVTDKVTVTDKDGREISVKENGDGKYSFTKPEGAVKISAVFKKEPPVNPGMNFTDVRTGDWFCDAVKFVVDNGLFKGVSDTEFAPGSQMTRAMFVTVLSRVEGIDTGKYGKAGFKDVPDNTWYSDAVSWASKNQIVTGYDEKTFGPNDRLTREQIAAILYRYAKYKGYDVSKTADLSGFKDVSSVSGYALESMRWANAAGLVNGVGANTLNPKGDATRAQAAALLMRFCQNVKS